MPGNNFMQLIVVFCKTSGHPQAHVKDCPCTQFARQKNNLYNGKEKKGDKHMSRKEQRYCGLSKAYVELPIRQRA